MVISLLTVMMAFVNGMYRLTQASGQPGNVMVMADGATDESFSNLAPPDMADLENQPGVLRENGHPLCSRETYVVVTQPIENRGPRPPDSPLPAGSRARRLGHVGPRAWTGPLSRRTLAFRGGHPRIGRPQVDQRPAHRSRRGRRGGPRAGGGQKKRIGIRPAPRTARRRRHFHAWAIATGSWSACSSRPARRSIPKSGPSGA